MALLDLTYAGGVVALSGDRLCPVMDDIKGYEQVDFTAGATESGSFPEGTRLIRILSDTNCRVVIKTVASSTAAENSGPTGTKILANQPEVLSIPTGPAPHDLSVIEFA